MATLYYRLFDDDSYQFFDYDHDVTLSVLSNHTVLTLTCAEKKVFHIYHFALPTTDDNLPGRPWNIFFDLNSELFFSCIYARPVAKRDGDIQWQIYMELLLHVKDSDGLS